MGAYLMMFAAWGAGLPLPLINVLAAIIYYYVNRNKGRFVLFHASQSLWSQVVVGLINAGVMFGVVRIIFWERDVTREFIAYVIVAAVVNLAYFVFSIIGAVRARQGRFFYFWFFGKLAYRQAYLVRDSAETKGPVNLPPSNS